MVMTNLPRLYVKDKFSRLIHPLSASITENITPLSTATVDLKMGEEIPARSYMELFTPYGSAGMFRVRSPHIAYGQDFSSIELEHMIAELGDYLVKAEYDQMIEANAAVKIIFGHYKGSHWQLGSYSAIGTNSIALQANYESVLNSLLSVLQQVPGCMMTFDFKTKPWTVNIVKKGTKVVAEGRLSRNVTTATVSCDDTELVTRVWYQTYTEDADGKKTGVWHSKDADTIKTYGLVESTVSTSSDMTDSEIMTTVDTYIREHKQPKVSVSIQAHELTKITGERMDRFLVGDLCRLAIPDYSIKVELNISSVEWDDVYNTPENVTVKLGDEEETVVTFLHNIDKTGSGSRGGSGGGGKKHDDDEKWKEYFTHIEQTDRNIKLTATRVDKNDMILEQAGMNLNSKGVLIYAMDKPNGVGARIQTQADRINLVVSGSGKNARINAAQIVMGINNESGKSNIKLKADTIDLDGYVTISELNATNGRIENLMSGHAVALKLLATTVSASVLMVGNSRAEWKLKKLADGSYINYLGA